MENALEAVVNGHKYRIGKMGTFDQLHVVRKMGPLMARLMELARGMPTGEGEGGVEALLRRDLADFTPFALALAALPDDDVNYVIEKALAVVSRQMENDMGWAPVKAPGGLVMMFGDIELPTMLSLVARTIWFNLRGFMPAAPSNSSPAAPAQ